jgi:hypothetical protein
VTALSLSRVFAASPRKATATSWAWGRFPFFTLTTAAGLAIVGAANRAAQTSEWWSEPAFYIGLLVLVLPIAARLLSGDAEGTERLSLVVLLALGLYLAKVLHDPITYGAYDEFLHWRTAQDMLITKDVFSPNTLLGVSPYYPGLELVTTAVSNVAGIPVYESGVIVLAAARVVFLMSLFFFFAMVSGSSRIAGIACLVYMTNPKFLYFNAQFSYESLALPLAALVLYVIARRGRSGPARWIGFTVVALVTIPAVITTHHVTSIMLVGFLVMWALVGIVMRRRDRARPGRMAMVTLILIAGWTSLVATATIGYLGPALTGTFSELLRLVGGELDPRELFVSRGGDVAPLWERLVGSASAGVALVLLPLGMLVAWRRHRSNPAVVALALAAALFPLTLIARLTRVGAEVSGRTPEFLYIGIGLVIALALARLSYRGRRGMFQMAAVTAAIGVMLVGGVIVGLPSWARLPGPYLVSADGRSVDAQGIAAANWTLDQLGPGNVMVADRVNRILMATYGQQSLVTTYETRLPIRRLYLASDIGPTQRQIVRDGQIRYLVVDRRLSTAPPVVGHYFDRGERSVIASDEPLDPQLLGKFDHQPDVSRVYDSGEIQLYDVSAIGDTAPPAPLAPGQPTR